MLYDAAAVETIVDSECAHEFLMEATRLASSEALEDTGRRLALKSELVGEWFCEERIEALQPEHMKSLAGVIFGMRRKDAALLKQIEWPALRDHLAELLYGPGNAGLRLEHFVGAVKGPPQPLRIALGSELLHYTAPQRYWLWTPWLWNPNTKAGALPLVLRADADLSAESMAGSYEQVGAALAAVNALGHAEGFAEMGLGLFGTHGFLACVYAVYMYTVFRMRLSKEFNRLLPELPELTRRILGVHKLDLA